MAGWVISTDRCGTCGGIRGGRDKSCTCEAAQCKAPQCDHYWASVHEPDHYLYWIRQCMICHQIDWAYLDEAIRLAAEEMLNGRPS